MPLHRLADSLILLPRGFKKAIVLLVDICACFMATWMAFVLRFDELVPFSQEIFVASVVSIFIAIPLFIKFGMYRAIFRFGGWFVTMSLVKSIALYILVYATFVLLVGFNGIPRSIVILQPVLFFVLIGSLRLTTKYLLISLLDQNNSTKLIEQKALIYGAGSAGRQLASGLKQGSEIEPIGFVDDNQGLWGGLINGLPVYEPSKLAALIHSNKGITDVLLAMPSASLFRRKEILATLSDLPVHVRILPGLSELANGSIKVSDIRDIEIEDILGRDQISINEDLVHRNITNKVIMVTGAGGSIGSELCRQILLRRPKTLVLFELSEYALYSIERELTALNLEIDLIPILGSVLDVNKLIRVLQRFGVNTVFHAAAYKHVPMIEINPASGVWNNVFGTLRAVEAASQSGVETFVLISTDKAVRPTNIMGCSKRLAELVLQAKSGLIGNLSTSATKMTMVRFGNVLGSSGSVVPVFRQQINDGGPVTVTHPEIIRYFMTIPEAAQLVIQAGAIGQGGDVMVLDMGEPVKILDLARRMIQLSGRSYKDHKNPNGDIEIQFTGLRPGEKLYEELLIGGNTLPTSHPSTLRAVEQYLSWVDLEPILLELEEAVKIEDDNLIIRLLEKAVPEFRHAP